DVRAADADLHVEPGLLVEALRRGRVVAGELRLRHPLQLEGDLRQLLLGVPGGRCRCSDRRPDAYGGPKCRKSPDPVLTSRHPVPFPTYGFGDSDSLSLRCRWHPPKRHALNERDGEIEPEAEQTGDEDAGPRLGEQAHARAREYQHPEGIERAAK